MPSAGEIRYPEESFCVECGRELTPGALECPACFGTAPALPPPGVSYEIERHLRRSRARMLVGALWVGLILPWAFLSAHAAGSLYRQRGLDEPALLERIHRHHWWSALAVFAWLLMWGTLFLAPIG